jgi:hypothetical protein
MAVRLGKDGQPRHKDYLAAGLPRPDVSAGLNRVGTVHDVLPFLAGSASSFQEAGALTVLDADGELMGVLYRRSNRFVALPGTEKLLRSVIDEPSYNERGFLTYRYVDLQPEDSEPGRQDEPIKRPVMIDMSVVAHGFNQALFSFGDALFVSSVLKIDLALILGEDLTRSIPIRALSYRASRLSLPVAFDAEIAARYQEIASEIRPTVFSGSPLTRTDLICAATAIVYGAPLYTTHPEDYVGIRGLRVIEYGPVRNKVAARDIQAKRDRRAIARAKFLEAAESTPPVPATPPTVTPQHDPFADGVSGILRQLARGACDQRVAEVVRLAAATKVDLSSAVADILDDEQGEDTEWRQHLLELLVADDTVLRADSPYRGNLIIAVGNILNTTSGDDDAGVRLREVAFQALGAWGAWPNDAADEVFLGLEDEPADETLLSYLRAYLAMAGVNGERAEREVEAVRCRAAVASRERIEALRGEVDTSDRA